MSYLRICLVVFTGLSLTLSGCDLINSNGNDNEDGNKSIEGIWELTESNGSQTFVQIEGDIITLFYNESSGGCFSKEVLKIVSVNGDVHTLESQLSLETEQVTIVRKGDQLNVTLTEDGETIKEVYESSTVDFGSLSRCVDDVTGQWEHDSSNGDVFYLTIDLSGNTLKLSDYMGDSHDQQANCYEFTEYTMEHLGGNEYTLENNNDAGEVFDVVFQRFENELQLTRDIEGQLEVTHYTTSNVDPGTFEPACS